MDRIGKEQADKINWDSPRLLCIAGDFTTYDEHAVKQIPRYIELIRYRRFGDELLLLELVNAKQDFAYTLRTGSQPAKTGSASPTRSHEPMDDDPSATTFKVEEKLRRTSDQVQDVFEALKAFLFAFGDDVRMKVNDTYLSFARIKAIARIEVRVKTDDLRLVVMIDPRSVDAEPGLAFVDKNSGGLVFILREMPDLELAKPFLIASYEAN